MCVCVCDYWRVEHSPTGGTAEILSVYKNREAELLFWHLVLSVHHWLPGLSIDARSSPAESYEIYLCVLCINIVNKHYWSICTKNLSNTKVVEQRGIE